MGTSTGVGTGIVFGRSQSWSRYWEPQSYVVENAAPTNIVLTYAKKIKEAPDKTLFTVKTTGSSNTVNSVSLDASKKILTVIINTSFIFGDIGELTINDGSSNHVFTITNNVNAESEWNAVYAAMPDKPSLFMSRAYNKFIKGRKASGVWSATVKFIYYATPLATQSKINWKAPGTLDPILSAVPPTHYPHVGYLGVPASGTYINSKFNPTRDGGTTYVLNDCGFGMFLLSYRALANKTSKGVYDPGAASFAQLDPIVAGNKIQYAINSAVDQIGADINNVDTAGFYHDSRTANNAIHIFKNDTKTDKAKNSNALQDKEFYSLARNNNDTGDRFDDVCIAVEWFTSSLSDSQVADLKSGLIELINTREITERSPKTNIAGKTCIYFGDSVTNGYNSAATNKDWVQLLTVHTGTTKDNKGTNGMSLRAGWTPNFMASYTTDIPAYNAATHGLIHFGFGINDKAHATYTNEADFITDLTTVVNYAINTKGWPKERVLIIAPSYTIYETIALSKAIEDYCNSEGIAFFDLRPYMASHGGLSITIDNVHPSDAGYQIFYEGLLTHFDKWFSY